MDWSYSKRKWFNGWHTASLLLNMDLNGILPLWIWGMPYICGSLLYCWASCLYHIGMKRSLFLIKVYYSFAVFRVNSLFTLLPSLMRLTDFNSRQRPKYIYNSNTNILNENLCSEFYQFTLNLENILAETLWWQQTRYGNISARCK